MELRRGGASRLRALATDCLPFEMPLEAGTPWLYEWFDSRFVAGNVSGVRVWAGNRKDLLLIALFGATDSVPIYADSTARKVVKIDAERLSQTWRAPASYLVRRDQLRTRQLDLLALGSQLAVAFIYSAHKESILYFGGRSRVSLRFPSRATSPGKHLQSRFKEPRPNRPVSIETTGRRLGTFNSFFAYEKYAFVGEFYDSKRWNALEAHWRYLRRIDVSNCFKSIYTHSFAWATGSDAHSKAHLGAAPMFSQLDFGRAFDKVMQTANWGETHGICVGPEASRIFAEIIFQKLDLEILDRLGKLGLKANNFEVLRYVDDYFIFTREETHIEKVSSVINAVLTEAGFTLNTSKTKDYVTPFTTEISMKKALLKVFLKQALPMKGKLPNYDIREVSVHLKAALVGSENDAQAVGASLSQVELRLRKFLAKRAPKCRNVEKARALAEYAWSFVHSMLYQYLSHPSVSSAMKVVRALRDFRRTSKLYAKLSPRQQHAMEYQADEFLHFAVTRAIQRLVGVPGSEVELCHFLSLASASNLDLSAASGLVGSLVVRLEECVEGGRSPKSNQAGVFLMLSSLKYFMANGRANDEDRTKLLVLCGKFAELLLGNEFLPGDRIKRHASQELFLLAMLECPYIQANQKLALLDKPWVTSVLISEMDLPKPHNVTARRFLKRCIADEAFDNKSLTAFAWDDDDFDSSLFQKEPQFIY